MTEVSLKEHFDERIQALDRAIDKAETQINERLKSMNEFREALRDQTGRLVTRTECGLLHEVVNRELKALRDATTKNTILVSLIVSIGVAVAVSLINHFLIKP